MNNNFQKTVNLRQKTKDSSPFPNRAEEIDKIYEGEEKFSGKIDKPKAFKIKEPLIKKILVPVFFAVIIATAYFVLPNNEKEANEKINWYAVELTNGEIYYGQIEDTSANPLVLVNVYYDYDQVNGEKKEEGEIGDIRLVKRGNETHGPSGTMLIYQVQIEKSEPLDGESKVLKAILDNEK